MGFEQQRCDVWNIYPFETFAFINIYCCQILLPTIPISKILFAHLALKRAGQEAKCTSLFSSRNAIYILTDHFICLEISNNVDIHHHWDFFCGNRTRKVGSYFHMLQQWDIKWFLVLICSRNTRKYMNTPIILPMINFLYFVSFNMVMLVLYFAQKFRQKRNHDNRVTIFMRNDLNWDNRF